MRQVYTCKHVILSAKQLKLQMMMQGHPPIGAKGTAATSRISSVTACS
jgi:hypothetical protein